MDLDAGYTHSHWPAEFVDLMLPPGPAKPGCPLADEITVQVQVTDRHLAETDAAATTADDLVVVCGAASAVLCRATRDYERLEAVSIPAQPPR